ncbi:MAG: ABC transporter ATP-binding protein [Planctomycetes bacterium]|nr:ABC transporter ATP-binding protein [Planctomycetota bacterium]
MSGAAVVRLRGVSKWYGPVIGVNRIDLEIDPGIVGLLGPNGAGKTTLIGLITGSLRPDLGEVEAFGRPVWNRPSVLRRMGCCPECDSFWDEMTGRAFVENLVRLSGFPRREAAERTQAALEAVGVTALADRRLAGASRGTRQRIKLAQALAGDPELLVLDEPLTGVDPEGRILLLDLFRRLGEEGRTIIFSSHILHEVEALTHRVILVHGGRVIAAGPVEEIRRVLADRPLAVRIQTDRPRELAALLARDPSVVEIAFSGDGAVDLRVGTPDAFFRLLGEKVIDLGADVRSLEVLDDSVAAVFEYLMR